MASDVERGEEEEEEEEESASELLRDRFRLCTISIAETEAKRNGMEISQPVMACISDLAFKYAMCVIHKLYTLWGPDVMCTTLRTVSKRCRIVCTACWSQVYKHGRRHTFCSPQ
ncbi:protein MHF1 homolog isoform X3 [Salvia hispanica]|uniref:protein MHF1 homolog isoform X3 n=1 Tax=Salvia hispanica TaxID=49212 RepID=UPI002009C93E|nr:protein MHF1 homolog isoform X3 [Salvia hispanica]